MSRRQRWAEERVTAFDDDVIVIGSGFGGSVAAMRAAEKGYRTAVIEAGRRRSEAELRKTDRPLGKFVWEPAFELFGIQRIRYQPHPAGASSKRIVGVPNQAPHRGERR